MKLVILQNQVGHYNLMDTTEESLAFKLAFKDDNNEFIQVGVDGLPVEEGSNELTFQAIFDMPRNKEDPRGASVWYEEMFNIYDWEGLFNEHTTRTGFTTGLDYPEQRIMFAYFMEKHYMEIQNNAVAEEKRLDILEISRLQKRLAQLRKKTYYDADPQDTPALFKKIIDKHQKESENFAKWRDEYKEGNENWVKWNDRIAETETKINRISSLRTEANGN